MKLETKDVVVTLSRKDIVKKVSLQVKNNDFVGLLGPNGSGKTTLLKSIYRVLKPSAGYIYLDDADIRMLDYRQTGDCCTRQAKMKSQLFSADDSGCIRVNIVVTILSVDELWVGES